MVSRYYVGIVQMISYVGITKTGRKDTPGYVVAGGVGEKIQCDACGVVLLWTNHSFPLPFECI